MSFTNEVVKQVYQGNNSTTTFAIPFEVLDDAETETQVYLIDTSVDPVTAVQKVISTDYSIVGSNVEMEVAPLTTERLLIGRDLDLIQELDLITSGAFLPQAQENELDRIVGMIQQVNDKVDRAPVLPIYQQGITQPLVLPLPSANKVLAWNSAGNGLENVTPSSVVITPAPVYSPLISTISPMDVLNYSLEPSVSGNALTITLKAANGTALSASNFVSVLLRTNNGSGQATSGVQLFKQITSPLTVTIPSTKTLGHVSTYAEPIYIYLLWDQDNAVFRLAVTANRIFNEGASEQTFATSSGTLRTRLCSDVASGISSIKLIGYMVSTQTVAGTWAVVPQKIMSHPPDTKYHSYNSYWYQGASGHGSSNTKIPYFTTLNRNQSTQGGAYISTYTVANSATTGFSHTQTSGETLWMFEFGINYNTDAAIGLSLNSNQLTTSIAAITLANVLALIHTSGSGFTARVTTVVRLVPGDVVRPHTAGGTFGTDENGFMFKATELGVGAA